jgi:hypothetical protein
LAAVMRHETCQRRLRHLPNRRPRRASGLSGFHWRCLGSHRVVLRGSQHIKNICLS